MADNKILLIDQDLPESRILSRFRSVFSIRTGIYNPIHRILKQHSNVSLFYYHPDAVYEKYISTIEGFFSLREVYANGEPDIEPAPFLKEFMISYESNILDLFTMLPALGRHIEDDIKHWYKKKKLTSISRLNDRLDIIGPKSAILVHKKAILHPGVILNASAGPIVIDRDVEISPFSYICGPVYIGQGARLDQVRMTGGCSIGEQVRLGGEVENSMIGDFSNKHHDGFLGHSILGRWVNMGAMVTTSDLKNNYGQVRLQVPDATLPSGSTKLLALDTKTMKFGAVIGDCVKIAIGTMLNTGTVIDAAANIFGGSPGKYTLPLSWGLDGKIYETERFMRDCETIFGRREQQVSPAMPALVKALACERIK